MNILSYIDSTGQWVELGFASLGLTVLGALCVWLRGIFWLAPAIGFSIFLHGAAYLHVRDNLLNGNQSPGNVGVPFSFHLLIPTAVLMLSTAFVRMAGFSVPAASDR